MEETWTSDKEVWTIRGNGLIGVYTNDFSFYHELISRMKERGIRFKTIDPEGVIPDYITVVIRRASDTLKGDVDVVIAEDYGYLDGSRDTGTVLNAIIDVAVLKTAGGNSGHVFIGVDPGRTPGLAIGTARGVIETISAPSISEAVETIVDFTEIFGRSRTTVRVGDGAPRERNLIINNLLEYGINVEIVDEHSTSSGHGRNHAMSAAAISMKSGRPVRRKLSHRVSMGYIRYIQEQSRIESGGRFTISRGMAEKVARGEMSISEAVEAHRDGK